MKNIIRFTFILTIIFLGGTFIFSKSEGGEDKAPQPIQTNTHEQYKIQALKIPANINFAGEQVPLEKNDVFERLDRELLVNTYWQSNGLLIIKRANKYFPVIEPILKENGVPDDFKYLAVIESGLTNVTSPAGAKGFWQIMKNTAIENGLEVNSNIDERYHLEKATQVACEYLIKSKEKLGSWTLAAAAYNGGNYGISSRLEKQKVNNYYDLLLGEETGRYVFRIIAVKEILSHPENYGFHYDNTDLYNLEKTKEITVNTDIEDLALFAKEQGITYKDLKIYNPWLREPELKNSKGKTYAIKIPITQ